MVFKQETRNITKQESQNLITFLNYIALFLLFATTIYIVFSYNYEFWPFEHYGKNVL